VQEVVFMSKELECDKMIHVWIPELFRVKGGIQVYSYFFLQAFGSIFDNLKASIFVKNDTLDKSYFYYLRNWKIYYFGNWPSYLKTLVFSAQIAVLAIWQRPRLVVSTHLHFIVAAYWLKRMTGIPYWTVAHGVEAWNIQRPALKKALHYADRILAVSGYTRDRLLKEQNLDPSKISILPNTFDANRFKVAPKPTYLLNQYSLEPEQPIILTVARLAEVERYKGYDKILEALPQIRQAIPNVHYIIVGKGDDRTRIEQLIAQLGLQNCVTLAGFVSDEQLCDYYNLCDLFAMPSKREGFGIVYLEALACGKPTLGGDQDGAIDALCHGELGALVNPDDPEAIAQTIIQILQKTYPNPLLYNPEALRQKVIDVYGFERFQKTLVQYIEEFFASQNS
jgi:glycosyltransferase involved in cell wall biosynthesis